MAQEYMAALLAFSNDKAWTEARLRLFETMGRKAMSEVARQFLQGEVSAEVLTQVTSLLLDHRAERLSDTPAVTRVERTAPNAKHQLAPTSPSLSASHTVQSTKKRSKTIDTQEDVIDISDQPFESISSAAGTSIEWIKEEEQDGSPGLEIAKPPFLFWVAATSTWATESDLGRAASSAIMDHFDKTYLSDEGKNKAYATFARGRNPAPHTCANMAVIRKYRSHMEFAGGSRDRACDGCVRTNRLCARRVDDYGGERSLGIYPLPNTTESESTWTSWVTGSKVDEG